MNDFREDGGWQTRIGGAKRALLRDKLGPAIWADMRGGVPVDTRELYDSLTFEVLSDDLLRVGSTDAEHSTYVEEGHEIVYRGSDGDLVHTGRMVPPQPYMKPALYRKRGG